MDDGAGAADGRGVEEEVTDQVRRVEESLEALERLPAGPRQTATAGLRALVDLYGEGWSRVLAHLERECPDAVASLAEDDLVGHLLLIHDLHPAGVEDRVRGAIGRVRPHLASEGREIELLTIEDGVARLGVSAAAGAAASAMDGGGAGGGSETDEAVAATVEAAVLGAAPELEGVVVEGLGGAQALVQIEPRRDGSDGREARSSSGSRA